MDNVKEWKDCINAFKFNTKDGYRGDTINVDIEQKSEQKNTKNI